MIMINDRCFDPRCENTRPTFGVTNTSQKTLAYLTKPKVLEMRCFSCLVVPWTRVEHGHSLLFDPTSQVTLPHYLMLLAPGMLIIQHTTDPSQSSRRPTCACSHIHLALLLLGPNRDRQTVMGFNTACSSVIFENSPPRMPSTPFNPLE